MLVCWKERTFPTSSQESPIYFCATTYYCEEWQVMDLSKVLEQLRREVVHLDAPILSLERLQAKVTRRGRPPKALEVLRKAHAPGRRQARIHPA